MVLKNHQNEFLHRLGRGKIETNYGRPSAACRRPHWEPPVLDYTRYEEGRNMFYTLNRHPESSLSPKDWYEVTDAEIEEDILIEHQLWIYDRVMESNTNEDYERAKFYAGLLTEIEKDGTEANAKRQALWYELFKNRRSWNGGHWYEEINALIATSDPNWRWFYAHDWDAEKKTFKNLYIIQESRRSESIIQYQVLDGASIPPLPLPIPSTWTEQDIQTHYGTAIFEHTSNQESQPISKDLFDDNATAQPQDSHDPQPSPSNKSSGTEKPPDIEELELWKTAAASSSESHVQVTHPQPESRDSKLPDDNDNEDERTNWGFNFCFT